MNITLIERFVLVVKYRNFAKAGAAAGVARETLCRNVASLEEKLGVRLLTRGSGLKEMDLTMEGKKFYEISSLLMASMHKLIEDTIRENS